MRTNTPPSSPFFERDDMIPDDQEVDDDGADDELIYVGDGKKMFSLNRCISFRNVERLVKFLNFHELDPMPHLFKFKISHYSSG